MNIHKLKRSQDVVRKIVDWHQHACKSLGPNGERLLSQLERIRAIGGDRIEWYEHDAVFTVDDMTFIHNAIVAKHTKNLFLKDSRGRFWLVTLPASCRADLKHIATTLGAGKLSFGKSDQMLDVLDVEPGAVTPLAVLNDKQHQVTVAIDKSFEGRDIAVHPMRNTATVVMESDTLISILRSDDREVLVAPLFRESH